MRQKSPQLPLKIFFAGIDGSGKSTCLELLLSRLNENYRILKIGTGSPQIFWKGKKETIINKFFYPESGHTPSLYESHHLRGLFIIFRFLANFLVTQYAKLRDKTDIIICETDTILHPSVYVTYYHPWTKKLKNSIRFKILNRLFGPRKNFVIFYLDTDPTTAMERIERRNTTFDRHENIDDLRMLKTSLDAVVEVALKSGVEVVKIDTKGKTRNSVCRDMERVLREKFSLTLSLVAVVIGIVF